MILTPLLTTSSMIFAHVLVKEYVKGDAAQDVLKELIDLAKEPSRLMGGRGDTGRIDDAASSIVKDMRPLFNQAREKLVRGSVDEVAAAVARTAVRANLGAALLIEKNLDPEAVREALFRAAQEERGRFSSEEIAFLFPILAELAYRITELATSLTGWNNAYPRAVLERLDDMLKQLADIRAERNEEIQEFEDEYRRVVRVELNRLDYIGIPHVDDTHRDQSLQTSYITLDVEPYSRSAKEIHSSDAAVPDGDTLDMGVRLTKSMAPGDMATHTGPASADDVLHTTRRLIVRGDAGAGKTTLLQWIGVQATAPNVWDRPAGWEDLVPFFLRLRKLDGKPFPNVEEFVQFSALQVPVSRDDNWARNQLLSGRAVILIDGVDELREKEREGMLEALRDLVSLFPNARYVISSRPYALNETAWPAWNRWVEREGFMQVTLRPMGTTQIESFIDHWHEAAKPCFTDDNIKADWPTLPTHLKAHLKLPQQDSLKKLAATPLLCAMICVLHVRMKDRMPHDRRDLYDDCINMLLRDREDKRHIPATRDFPNLPKADRRDFARAFAYAMIERNEIDIPVSDADAFFEERVYRKRDKPSGRGVRRLLAERCSLLRYPVEDRVDFRHKTFQEFLAAEYAVKKQNIPALAEKGVDDDWREVIILAASLFEPEDCEELLRRLINTSEQNPKPFTLALACLDNDNASDEVRREVVEACQWLFPPTLESAETVALAGDPAIPFLTLTDGMEPDTRAACIRALARIGTPEALDAIVEHVRAREFHDQEIGILSWQEFVSIVGAGWERFDCHEYARRVLSKMRWLYLETLNSEDGWEEIGLQCLWIRQSLPNRFEKLARMPHLSTLYLTSTQVGDVGLSDLSSLLNLTNLYLKNTGVSDAGLFHFSGLSNLKILDLTGTQVSDVGLSYLSGLPNLTKLGLRNTRVSDAGLSYLSGLPNLTWLHLMNTNVSDAGLFHLAGLSSLKILDLTGTRISDAGLFHLSGLSNLKILDLTDTQVSDAGLSVLSGIPGLKIWR